MPAHPPVEQNDAAYPRPNLPVHYQRLDGHAACRACCAMTSPRHIASPYAGHVTCPECRPHIERRFHHLLPPAHNAAEASAQAGAIQ